MNLTKLPVVAIALFCQSCMIIPVPIPVSNGKVSPSVGEPTQKLSQEYSTTCYANALTEAESQKIVGDSASLEAEGDRLAAQNKHEEALRRYNEASAVALNEYLSTLDRWDKDESQDAQSSVELFLSANEKIIQRGAEMNFKIGLTYAQLNKTELAIDCFNETLRDKGGIAPPNNAAALLNRGDAYLKLGDKDKARQDYEEAAKLFEEYKLPDYKKRALDKLQNANAQ